MFYGYKFREYEYIYGNYHGTSNHGKSYDKVIVIKAPSNFENK